MTKLFIGGIPLTITEMELVQVISMHGNVSTIKIVRDKVTSKCKGYAFVEMTSQEAAENTITGLNGTAIGDRQLTVRLVPEENTIPPANMASQPAPVYKKVEKYASPVKRKRPRRTL